jgi:membrane protein
LNRAYEVEDWKPIWWRRLQSMVVVIVGALILFVASLAVILGPAIWRIVEFFEAPGGEAELVWTVGRYALATAVLAAGLLALHHWLPNKDWPTRALLPGVLLTLGLWLLGATLFSFYLGTVADYSVTYGSLGGVVITLFFFYLTAILFILGAEYNMVRRGAEGAEN